MNPSIWQRLADAETAVTDCATCGRALDVWALRGGGCQQCSASMATPPVDATPPTGRPPSRPVGGTLSERLAATFDGTQPLDDTWLARDIAATAPEANAAAQARDFHMDLKRRVRQRIGRGNHESGAA